MTENLFSYGTLQTDEVQLKTFGRLLEGKPDMLACYRAGLVKIEDAAVVAATGMTHYQNLIYTGNPHDKISGMVFMITAEELNRADKYESEAGYKRILVVTVAGRSTWVYFKIP